MTIGIIGAGQIAREYIKVLQALKFTPFVIGRGLTRVNEVKEIFTGVEAVSGGLTEWLKVNSPPEYCIVATPVEHLKDAVISLLHAGSKYILVEKPLAFTLAEVENINLLARNNNARVHIAFNRRNYTSVAAAKKLIADDGGASSIHFDFTEAIFRIFPNNYDKITTKFWGVSNSAHVIDTAFYLCGFPVSINSNQYGNDVSWHIAGSIFTGHGITRNNVPFTYHANWGCPGKWNIEVNTAKRRLIFSPMEELRQQKHGSFKVERLDLDYSNDLNFKPGFFKQVKLWTEHEFSDLMSITEYKKELFVLYEIFGYS